MNVHPAAWKSKLKKLDQDTYELVKWVSRQGDWFVLEADPANTSDLLARLQPLRKLGVTVEECGGDEFDDGDVPEEVDRLCAEHLAGRKCVHKAPYCK